MASLLTDIRYGLRTLVRKPGFTAVVALTIGLGIGANTAIFSVVRAVLLRPLPYDEPHELVLVWGAMTNRNVEEFPTSPPTLRDMKQDTEAFDALAGIVVFSQPLTGGVGDPQEVQSAVVDPEFFRVFGVEPTPGRGLVAEDALPGGDPLPGAPGFFAPAVVVLSHGLWQTTFGGDPSIIGRTIELGGSTVEVVGVMPEGFRLLMPSGATASSDVPVEAWMPLRIDPDAAPRENVFLTVVGRLRDGATLERAQSEMDRVAAKQRELSRTYDTAGYEIDVVPLRRDLTAGVRPTLLALLGAVGFVLLIACANVTNLLLVRSSSREREIAIRSALGGGRGQLIRQLMLESGLLSMVGGVVGLFLAWWGIRLLFTLQPGDLPRMETVTIDGMVLGFTLVASLVAALLFGTIPAIKASKPRLADWLKDRGTSSLSRRQKLFRNGIVVAEVALSLVLLIGAGLMMRSFIALQNVEPGYDPEGVLTFETTTPLPRYPEPGDRSNFATGLQERLAGLPGVSAVSAAIPVPLSGQVQLNGRYGTEEALADESAYRQADYRFVLPGYFEAMGTRVLAGRTFTDVDMADSANTVVVDRKLAERTWPGESAVGKRFLVRLNNPSEPEWVRVIGVVEHQRSTQLAREGREAVYFNYRFAGSPGLLGWVVRSRADPAALTPQIRRAVTESDRLMPVADVRTMSQMVDQAMAPTRFTLALIGVFALIALALAAVGLYGVLSYVVRQRTAEIGVRMAFGAESSRILRLVVGQGLALTVIGVGAGVLAALGLTRLMAGFLIGVDPTDPLTFVAISALFVGVGVAASFVPARRATLVDPVVALRQE